MNPVKLWVDALRSGKYEQGMMNLRRCDLYCCLGVACELYQEHVGGLEVEVLESGVYSYGDGCTLLLPDEVAEWLGLSDPSGGWRGSSPKDSLAMLNDDHKSFKHIADVIESPPPGLFKEAKNAESVSWHPLPDATACGEVRPDAGAAGGDGEA